MLAPTWLEELLKPIEAGADVSMGYYEPVVESFFDACMAAVNLPDDPRRSTPRGSTRRHARSPTGARRSMPWAGIPNGWRSARTCGWTCAGANVVSTCGSHPMRSCTGACAATSPRRGASTSGTRRVTPRPACTPSGTPCGSRPTVPPPPQLASRRTWPKLLAAAGALTYARTPIRRAWRRLDSPAERALATLAVPALMALTDTAKMAGYAAGLSGRLGAQD